MITLSPDHKIKLGVTINLYQWESDKACSVLTQELIKAIADLPITSKGSVLSWKAIRVCLELHGVEFNNDELLHPDICFNLTYNNEELRIDTNILFMTVDRVEKYSYKFLSLKGTHEQPLKYEQACIFQACNQAAKDLLKTCLFLRAL